MKFHLPRIARVPRPPWPRRERTTRPQKPRRERTPSPAPVAELGGTLRVFRAAALWGIAVLILTAAGSAFAESYRGLWLWALHHGLAGFWAAAMPLQIDLFVAVGELVLFIAMVDRWNWRDRMGAWAVALVGLAVSIAGNVGHVAAHDLQTRGTAAIPPVAAFAALWLGLGVLKRIVKQRNVGRVRGVPVAADETAQQGDADAPLGVLLADLADAVRALAKRADDAVPSPDAASAQNALLADLLDAVRGLGGQISGAVSSPVPTSAEDAALIALRSTTAAGNPLSDNQLMTRFGLTRTQAKNVRVRALGEPAIRYAPQLEGAVA